MLIDGKAISADMKQEIADKVAQLKKDYGVTPGLATVLVGDDPASHSYVRSKRKTCAKLGIESFAHELPADTSQETLENLIRQLNDDPKVHGILVQVPLPGHLNEKAALDLISFDKDVDGFHPMNIGMLTMKGRNPRFVSCTPAGCMVLIQKTLEKLEGKTGKLDLSGKSAVVLGRSNIVGMPVSLLLIHANATVTVVHSRTADQAAECRKADILVAAVGKPKMVKKDWVKPGAIVIDVGTNRVDDESRPRGYYLTGDVATAEVEEVAAAVSPSPGGVGPMTITMLMQNTYLAAEAAAKK